MHLHPSNTGILQTCTKYMSAALTLSMAFRKLFVSLWKRAKKIKRFTFKLIRKFGCLKEICIEIILMNFCILVSKDC